jgi:hypothetical protein
MNVKFNDKGELVINFWDALEYLPTDQKLKLIETLSCNEEIIKHVADQLLEGFTQNTCCGADNSGEVNPTYQLNIQRRRIAEMAGEVAKKEIADMLRNLERAKENEKKYSDKYWKLWHSWPQGWPRPVNADDF